MEDRVECRLPLAQAGIVAPVQEEQKRPQDLEE